MSVKFPCNPDVTVAENVIAFVETRGSNHSRKDARRNAPFIAWDGEGARNAKDPTRQDYILLGNSSGEYIRNETLTTLEMLAFIVGTGRKHPDAIHVGFGFSYDANMILRDLPPTSLWTLKELGSVIYGRYRVEHVPNKWLTITERGQNFQNDENDKSTVRIYDIISFFQSSFLQAIRSYIPDHPDMAKVDVVEAGKAERNNFTYAKVDYITEYWTVEIRLLKALVDELRRLVYDVDLNITQWYGPGAIANYVYKQRGVAPHMAETPLEVHEAAKYGYAGGRFEMFRFGRFQGPIYSCDINSAYPAAIARLPSLSNGEYWQHYGPGTDFSKVLSHFGIYHVRLKGEKLPSRQPAPAFHRDHAHNITFPWFLEGWYWTPEVANMLPLLRTGRLEILEAWEYDCPSDVHLPFTFVEDVYNQRRDLKAQGIGSERALKLALNSLYGKMAQRVGWERAGRAPRWHQLEWAGWVTSYTRAMLYQLIMHVPPSDLIAVETDGIYTTFNPEEIGLSNSKALGEWEIKEYKQMFYLQSGVYFLQDKDGSWVSKYRGLDKGSLTPDMAEEFLRQLTPNPTLEKPWPAVKGPTTRFIGYRAALHRQTQGMGPLHLHHCNWETTEREITIGVGKRGHTSVDCTACDNGSTAWEEPHDTVIISRSILEPLSTPHPIPWEDNNSPKAIWRQLQQEEEGLIP